MYPALRIHLAPDASETVTFDLSARDVSMVTETGERIVSPGKYAVSIGGGQPGSGLPGAAGSFSVSGQMQLPE